MKKAIKVILFIAVLCAAVYYIGLPWYQIDRADKLLYQGEFSKAEELVTPYTDHFVWGKTARAELRDLYTLQAAKSMQAKDYVAAAKAYEKLNDEENTYKAWMALGDTSMSISDYEHAVEGYSNAGEKSLVNDAYASWGDQMLASHKFDKARQYYQLAGQASKLRTVMLAEAEYLISIKKPTDVRKVIKGYTGNDIADVVFKAFQCEAEIMREDNKSNDGINELAAKYGTWIRDIDTQLIYCSILTENGYSLKKVYPEGVEIDYSISKYQIYEKAKSDSNVSEGGSTSQAALLDDIIRDSYHNANNSLAKKILCFSRIENKPELSVLGLDYGTNTSYNTGLTSDTRENPLYIIDNQR